MKHLGGVCELCSMIVLSGVYRRGRVKEKGFHGLVVYVNGDLARVCSDISSS